MINRWRRCLAIGGVLAAGSLLVLAGPAAAHAELVSSDPAAGSQLEAAPDEVVITFSAEIAPESSFAVLDPDGGTVSSGELDLDIAERNVLRGAVDITQAGAYSVEWSVIASDGHPSEGSFTFGVGSAEAPDTAVAPASPIAILGGAALLGLALVAAASRRRAPGR